MPWRDSQTVPLTRIDIVSQIPSESGIYAISDGDVSLVVGEAWNLKARLLELMSVLQDVGQFRVTYELCPEDQRVARKQSISAELLKPTPPVADGTKEPARKKRSPGISFRDPVANQ